VLALLFFRARRHETAARAFATRYGAGDAIGAAIWLASAAVPPPAQYVVWGIGMAVLMATPPLAVMAYHGKAFNAAHIAERYGLFTLIVLGESVVAVAAALGGEAGVRGGLVAAIGFGVAACIWWVYFGSVRRSSLTRDSLLRSFTWGYGHLFVFGGVAATAVGVHLAADAASGGGHLAASGYWIYAGGLDAVLLALVAIHFVTVMRWDVLSTLRLSAAIALAALAPAAGGLGPVWFSVCVFAVLVALTIAETRLLGPAAADQVSPQIGG
jgi:low temperature requirement protein LtrA